MTDQLFLTGDIHHPSLKTKDQEVLDGTEIDAAITCGEIAADYGVPLTLFVSGRTAVEQPDAVKELSEMPNVVLGGHNWDCFAHNLLHTASEFLTGSYYGPKTYQKKDIEKTCQILHDVTGTSVSVWRSHGFVSDIETNRLLRDAGISVVSNSVAPNEKITQPVDGLYSIPVTAPPDHSSMYHGWLDESFVAHREQLSSSNLIDLLSPKLIQEREEWSWAARSWLKSLFDSERRGLYDTEWYSPEEWCEIVIERCKSKLANDDFATVLAHPSCMEIADSLTVFERICAYAANQSTAWISDIKKDELNAP